MKRRVSPFLFPDPRPPLTIVFKVTLRQHLETVFPNQELSRWFDPLDMSVDDERRILRVSFPHLFFGQWFLAHRKQDFELQLSKIVADLSVVYEAFSGSPAAGSSAVDDSSLSESSAKHVSPEADVPYRERHSFATFLANRKNDFPLAAAKEAVSREATPSYTPFVIYGQSGAGKSHLLGAMASAARDKGFSLFHGDVAFLERMRLSSGLHSPVSERMIFLDDTQRVADRPDIQDALTALIDMSLSEGRLLALALDAHPSACPGLGQKLRSRLMGGLVLELKLPDLDIRRQYIERENARRDFRISRQDILQLAQRHQDIRGIEGALARLSVYRSLLREQEEAIPDMASILDPGAKRKNLTPASIILTVARYFSLPPEEISGKSRDRAATRARHVAILLCRELLGLSLVRIGQVFAGRDHTSVLYSIKKMNALQINDSDAHILVEELRTLCLQ